MNKKGFTLVEIVIVLGIFAILAAAATPFLLSQVVKNRIASSAKQIVSALYIAQQNSYSGKSNASYGVQFTTSSFTMFRGNTFAGSTDPRTVNFTAPVQAKDFAFTGGVTEVVFAKGGIKPNTTGNFKLTDGKKDILISINAEGLITSQLL